MGIKGILSFLSAPLIGALSDVWGRKFFLLITVFFTCAPIPLMTINTWWVYFFFYFFHFKTWIPLFNFVFFQLFNELISNLNVLLLQLTLEKISYLNLMWIYSGGFLRWSQLAEYLRWHFQWYLHMLPMLPLLKIVQKLMAWYQPHLLLVWYVFTVIIYVDELLFLQERLFQFLVKNRLGHISSTRRIFARSL